MKGLLEYARDHTAVKQERANVGVDVDETQLQENGDWMVSMLEGTGIEPDELSQLSLAAMESVAIQLAQAGEIEITKLLEVIGSVWSDGVIFGACWVRDTRDEKARELWTP